MFRYTGAQHRPANIGMPAPQHLIRRNIGSTACGTLAGRAGGFYVAGYVESDPRGQCLLSYGWRIGASRDDDPSVGGATVFSHPYYLQTDTSGHGSPQPLMDGAGDGANARGDTFHREPVHRQPAASASAAAQNIIWTARAA